MTAVASAPAALSHPHPDPLFQRAQAVQQPTPFLTRSPFPVGSSTSLTVLMDIRRQLLPVSLDSEEGHRKGCALEAAVGVANEQPPSERMAAAAAPGVGDKQTWRMAWRLQIH
ncbi:unnamed protein product [Urochloa humidicola]